MVHLSLTAEEAVMLSRALNTYISDLRMEVADTDQQRFRDDLKTEEAALLRILTSLSSSDSVRANA